MSLERTELHNIILAGSEEEAIQYIKNEKYNIDEQDETGFTYLHCAIQIRSLSLVELLVKGGADINVQDIYGKTPLLLALSVYNGDTSIIEFLLDNNADTTIATNGGVTPLKFSKVKGIPVEIVKRL